jgi:excinuclease ABC subunit A
MQEIVPNMQLERFKTHDIEVVVDRILVQDKSKDRLRTSMQTALKSGNGMVIVLGENDEVFPYSKHLMDPESGISYEEPSPNTLLFQFSLCACPSCNGLGTLNQVDIEKVIPDYNKTINDGGIAPLGEVRQNNLFDQLRLFAKNHSFTFATPIKDIPEMRSTPYFLEENKTF